MKKEISATIEKRGRWYVGYIPDVPGVNSQGRTLKEVKGNLTEALALVLEANKELAKPKRVTLSLEAADPNPPPSRSGVAPNCPWLLQSLSPCPSP